MEKKSRVINSILGFTIQNDEMITNEDDDDNVQYCKRVIWHWLPSWVTLWKTEKKAAAIPQTTVGGGSGNTTYYSWLLLPSRAGFSLTNERRPSFSDHGLSFFLRSCEDGSGREEEGEAETSTTHTTYHSLIALDFRALFFSLCMAQIEQPKCTTCPTF